MVGEGVFVQANEFVKPRQSDSMVSIKATNNRATSKMLNRILMMPKTERTSLKKVARRHGSHSAPSGPTIQ